MKRALFLLLLLALAASCARKQPPLLRYAFSTEGVQRYRTMFNMSTSSGSGTAILIEETHRAREISLDGKAQMEVRFDTAWAQLTVPHSAGAAFLVRTLQGRVLDFSVSSRGEIASLGDSSTLGDQARETMAQTFSQIFPLLPDGPVRPGDSWTSERDVPMPWTEATEHVVNQYTLKGFERRKGKECARVGIQTTSQLLGAVTGQEGRVLLGSMTGKGEYLFSLQEGRLLELTMKNATEVSSRNSTQGENKTTSEQVVKVQALE